MATDDPTPREVLIALNAHEEWRPVVGYEGLYDVSSLGNVRSYRVAEGRHSRMAAEARLMSPAVQLGRRVACLRGQAKRTRHYVSNLVLKAFVGPRPAGMEACHWDGNSQNDRLDNLRWDTHAANIADNIRLGVLIGRTVGEDHPCAKLWDEAIRCIRAEPGAPRVGRMLARAFGVSESRICEIRKGRSWKHVEQFL